MPSCIDWYPAVKECIGIEKWMELIVGEKLKIKVNQLFSESVSRYYEHILSVVENMKIKKKGGEEYVF